MTLTQNLNPQNLKAGETCEERWEDGETFYYLGFACGTSMWQRNYPWSEKDKAHAKTHNCGFCCCADE